MTPAELIKKIKIIELNSKRKTNAVFLGEYHSAFKGIGMMFSEVRKYQYGDDIRKIDWNITARFNETYIKTYEEERELTSLIIVDISASMNFGTKKQLKRETVAEIVATLALSAVKNNDKVGLLLFSDKINLFLKPAKGKRHLLRIIRELLEYESIPCQMNLDGVFRFLLNSMKRKTVVFLFSDFDTSNFEKSLQIITKKHDFTGIRVYDDKENSFPDIGLAYLQDLETGNKKWVNTSSIKVRNEYDKYYNYLIKYLEKIFHQNNAGFLNIPTDGDYIKILFNYFKNHNSL